jgi:HEAT repeat protein
LKTALLCAFLAALTGVAVQAMLLLHAATVAARALPGAVSAELAAVRMDFTGQVAAARQDLLTRTERQVAALRTDLMSEVSQIRSTADQRVGDTLGRVDAALATVNALHDDLKPTLDNAAAITGQAKDAAAILLRRDALPAQLLGVTAAAKVTLGQTAETMRDIQRATPQMLTTWNEIGANVKATTQASTEASRNTAQVMANFARATKPLPTWARIGLAVAPPLAQVGASVATTLAVTGSLGK